MESAGIDVKAIFDSIEGKEIEGRIAEALDNMDRYSSKTVCIVTPAKDVADVWDTLCGYYESVIDVQILY